MQKFERKKKQTFALLVFPSCTRAREPWKSNLNDDISQNIYFHSNCLLIQLLTTFPSFLFKFKITNEKLSNKLIFIKKKKSLSWCKFPNNCYSNFIWNVRRHQGTFRWWNNYISFREIYVHLFSIWIGEWVVIKNQKIFK